MRVTATARVVAGLCLAACAASAEEAPGVARRAALEVAAAASGKDTGARLLALERAPGTGIPGLEEAARRSSASLDRTERTLALELLARIDVAGNRERFVEALESPYRSVRIRAIKFLLKLSDPALAPLFVSRLEHDPDPDLQALAARGPGVASLPSGRAALARAVEAGHTVVQRAAVEALAASGDLSFGPGLLERAIAADGAEKKRLLGLVGLVPDPALVPQLEPLLDHPSGEVRVAAAVAILSILDAVR